jgi:hypothetical protein
MEQIHKRNVSKDVLLYHKKGKAIPVTGREGS